MKNRYFITYGLLIAGLFLLWGCNKATNIVAPSGSIITVSATPGTTVPVGQSITVYASVTDSAGKPMNGIGVKFTSSNPAVASFSTTSAVGQTSADTNASGYAAVTVGTLAAGSADISADVTGISGSITLTVQ